MVTGRAGGGFWGQDEQDFGINGMGGGGCLVGRREWEFGGAFLGGGVIFGKSGVGCRLGGIRHDN